jgi:hypothetical protein
MGLRIHMEMDAVCTSLRGVEASGMMQTLIQRQCAVNAEEARQVIAPTYCIKPVHIRVNIIAQ